jgi:serine/threonine-protein kinase
MFLDEARLAAQLRHPNVVGVLDLDRNEAGPFLVMEFVDGPSLNALLKGLRARGEQLPLELVLRIQLDLLAGLHAAHELRDAAGRDLGIVHRDVSPANVLVGRDGVARITDFGAAKAESRLAQTEVGQIKGKVPYMAPEQLRGLPTDRRADVYAAGCVLWEVVALRRVIEGDDYASMLASVLAGPRTSLRAAGHAIPTDLDDVVATSLAPLERRFGTARAFAEHLEGAARRAGLRVAHGEEVAEFVRARHPSLLTSERLTSAPLARAANAETTVRAGPHPGETTVTHVAGATTKIANVPIRRGGQALLPLAGALVALGVAAVAATVSRTSERSAVDSFPDGTSARVAQTPSSPAIVASNTAMPPTPTTAEPMASSSRDEARIDATAAPSTTGPPRPTPASSVPTRSTVV